MEISHPKPNFHIHPSPPLLQEKQTAPPLLFFRLCTGKLNGAFSNADLCEIDKELYALHWDDNENFNQHTMFDFPFQDQSTYGLYRVVGTCNGLVCIADDLFNGQYFILWNPCLRKFLVFPRHVKFWFRTQPGNDVSTGIGFDAKTNDYKVVWFLTFLDVENQGESLPEVEVYLLATGEWKTLTAALPPTGAVCYSHPQAFVNGALHWLAWKKTKDKILLEFIMVLDLGDEVFRQIALPKNEYHSISAYGNSLALFQVIPMHFLNVWVMKEYGHVSGWTKIVILADQDPIGYIPTAKGFRKSGEIILETNDGKLFSRDLET